MNFETADAVKRLPDQYFSKIQSKIQLANQRTNKKIINLSIGTPDLLPPRSLREELKKAVDNPINNKYGPFRGNLTLKQAVATYYKEHYDVHLDAESEIAVFDGTKGAIIKLTQALLNPGDTALLTDPGYPDYKSGIALADAHFKTIPLTAEKKYLVDYKTIPPSVAQEAKLIFLNYPNNPTGAHATPDFIKQTVEFAKKNKICVVHDAAYGPIVFDNQKPISFLQSPGAKKYGVELYSLSKMLNISGWRVGFAVGNPSVIEAMNKLQEHTTVSLYGGIQEAISKVLNNQDSFVINLRQTYERRRDIVINELKADFPEIFVPKGSFFIWIKIPEHFHSANFTDYLLNHAQVVVADGAGFGEYGKGYIRISLVDSDENLIEAAKRIKKAIRSTKI